MERILSAYEKDPMFKNKKRTKRYRLDEGFWLYGNRIVVPNRKQLQKSLIEMAHQPPTSGHTGAQRTYEQLRRTFYWPGMVHSVKTYVHACTSCQRNKASTRKPGGLLRPTEIPQKFWECVTMDLITQLPKSKHGFDAVAVFVDKLSKMTHIEPCHTAIGAEAFATLMFKSVFRHHGLPRKIISDRDARFTGKFLTELAKIFQFRQALSTAFHPQTDGQTERMNRVIEDMVRHYVSPYSDDWDEFLPMVEFSINNAWQASIQNTPFYAIYGSHPHTPTTLRVADLELHRVPAAQKWLSHYADRTAHARTCLQSAQDRQKAYADTSRRAVKYSRGDHVWLSTKNVHFKQGGSTKFMPKYIGPFEIIDLIGPRENDAQDAPPTAVKLKLPPHYRLHPVFHVSLIKPLKTDGTAIPLPDPVEIDTDGTPIFEAEAILAERNLIIRNKPVTRFLIRWSGYPPEHDTWVDSTDLFADELLATWRNREA
jgi:hypothetical protein